MQQVMRYSKCNSVSGKDSNLYMCDKWLYAIQLMVIIGWLCMDIGGYILIVLSKSPDCRVRVHCGYVLWDSV